MRQSTRLFSRPLKFHMATICVALTAFLIGNRAFATQNATCEPDGAAPADIRRMMERWLEAYNGRDIERLMTFYSPDIYYANNGSKTVTNIQSIRENWMSQFKSPVKTEISFIEDKVSAGPKFGHIMGRYRISIEPPGTERRYAYGRVLLIFERNLQARSCADVWKLVVDFDNNGDKINADDFAH